MLELKKIQKGHQARAAINEATVSEYAKHIEDGGEFPPIIVYFDSKEYWLGDGYHRLLASERIGCLDILEEVRIGTSRDALKHALGANAYHGLPRTNADKRNAVEIALDDSEWSRLSTREIAKLCNVSHNLVAEIQRERNPVNNTVVKESSVIGLQPSDIPDINRNENVRPTSMAKPIEHANSGDDTETDFGNMPLGNYGFDLRKDTENPPPPTREEELEARIAELEEQNRELSDLLSDYQKAHTPEEDGKLSEFQKIRIELDTMTKSRNAFQTEGNELKRQIKMMQKKK